MTISEKLFGELLSGVENADDLLGEKGLMKGKRRASPVVSS